MSRQISDDPSAAASRGRFDHPYHPVLFGVFFTLYLYASNIHEADPIDLPIILGASVLLAAASWLVMRVVLRNGRRAGIASSVFLVLFFSYGHVRMAVEEAGIVYSEWMLAIPFLAVFVAVLVPMIRTRRTFANPTKIANGIGLVVVVITVSNVGMAAADLFEAGDDAVDVEVQAGGTDHPDIYFILPDEYGGSDSLQSLFGFDNSEFEDFLKSRGFVVPDVRSNYQLTYVSVPSILNMRHMYEEPGFEELYKLNKKLVSHNEVMRELRRHGYTIIIVESNVSLTNNFRLADMELCHAGILQSVLFRETVRTTMLEPLAYHLALTQRDLILCSLETIPTASDLTDKPAFVFAHMMTPHNPFIFDKDGNVPDAATPGDWGPYVGQVQHLNSRLMDVIDKILARDEQSIIIIQSDHGYRSENMRSTKNFSTLDDTEIRNSYTMMGAYRFPDGADDVVYDGMTSVNTFRLIFDRYFGGEYGLEEDRYFAVWSEDRKNVDFREVTDRLDDDR